MKKQLEQIEFAITYSVVDDESAGHGEVADSGFIDESYIVDCFDDIFSLLKRYNFDNPSSYPLQQLTTNDWLSSEPELDYEYGEYTTYSLHAKNDRAARYLTKAYNYINRWSKVR